MTDPEKARKAFEEQDEYGELVVIDEDGNVHPVEETVPKGKKTTILRDPKGEYL